MIMMIWLQVKVTCTSSNSSCLWSGWAEWGACSVSCNSGTQVSLSCHLAPFPLQPGHSGTSEEGAAGWGWLCCRGGGGERMRSRGMSSRLQVGFLGHLGPLLGHLWQGNTEVRPNWKAHASSFYLVNCRRFREVVEGASKGGSACPGQAEEERACATNQCPGETSICQLVWTLQWRVFMCLLLVWAEWKSTLLTFYSPGSDDPEVRASEPELVGECLNICFSYGVKSRACRKGLQHECNIAMTWRAKAQKSLKDNCKLCEYIWNNAMTCWEAQKQEG